MISYTEALQHINDLAVYTEEEVIPLEKSCGRYLAADIYAPWAMPRFTHSAMDGFAHHAGDGAEAPVTLKLVGESSAGHPYVGSIQRGEAIRISTGAMLPDGIDGITPVECATVEGERLTIQQACVAGRYRRVKGSDIQQGQCLCEKGTRLTPAMVGLLASFNMGTVSVVRKPRIGILTSGNELRYLGQELGEGQIVASSHYYLLTELESLGCEAQLFGISPDETEYFEQHLKRAIDWSDVVITTAGVSVGEHDVVKEVVANLKATVLFWRVSIRPGKPMLLCHYDGKPHFGFPGNPVSTCCNTELFLKPYLRRWFGAPEPELLEATLTKDCPRDRQRLFFVYGLYDGARFTPLDNQNSGNLLLPAEGNAMAVVEPGDEVVKMGAVVRVMVL